MAQNPTNYSLRSLLAFAVLILCLQAHTSIAGTSKDEQNLARANQINNNKIFNNDIVLGSREAKILVIEYFAPTCTHCADYHVKILPYIKQKYIDTGKIAYVMRECVGNKQDLDASILARCTSDTKSYQTMMHQILISQDHWAYNKDYRQQLINIGKQHNISEQQYQTCLADDSITDILFSHAKLTSNDNNFIGTPSFYINGQLFNGLLNIEELSKVIDSQLSKEDES